GDGRGRGGQRGPAGGDVDAPSREGDVFRPPPGDEERVRGDDAVVAESDHRGRMDLEMEMRRAAVGVSGRADEPDDVARFHALPFDGERWVRGQVRVVELVARPTHPPHTLT